MDTVRNGQKVLAGKFLTFKLKSELFGIPIQDVREINSYGDITPVPYTADAVKGVMNLRGKIIPVVSLRKKFGMDEIELTRECCVIVIEAATGLVGMVVDSVQEVQDFLDSQIELTPPLGTDYSNNCISGLGKIDSKVVILVDVKTAFLTTSHPSDQAA